MVAATTWSEYKQYIEQDAALTRRMQPVVVDEPDEASAISMMRMVAPRFAEHHGVRITDEALIAAVKLSKRHLPGRQLPDKSISLLDTACARVAMSQIAPPSALEIERQAVRALDLQLQWIAQDQAMSIVSGIDTGRRALQVKANDLSLDAGNNLSLQACHIQSDSQRLVQKTAEHTLHAAGTSATHANSVAVQAERSLNLRSQLGIIQTSSLLKIDGAQVHFG